MTIWIQIIVTRKYINHKDYYKQLLRIENKPNSVIGGMADDEKYNIIQNTSKQGDTWKISL